MPVHESLQQSWEPKVKKKKAIPDAEWIITARLVVGNGDDAHEYSAIEMFYADSVVADGWLRVASLIAGRMDEARARIAPGLLSKRKKK
jgi:hypothetical protein